MKTQKQITEKALGTFILEAEKHRAFADECRQAGFVRLASKFEGVAAWCDANADDLKCELATKGGG